MRIIDPMSPELLPVLSHGKHRNARRGACFMEYASHLAGERWSDHPDCTHPALAALARLVNDWSSDTNRARLAPMIPSVIGLLGEDQRLELLLAVRAAVSAVPIASEERQRVLAVGLLACESRLTDLDPGGAPRVRAMVRAALDQVPLAERWARQYLAITAAHPAKLPAPACGAIVAVAVAGIGEACVPDPDDRLRELLRSAIDDCELLLRRDDPAHGANHDAEETLVVA